MAELSEDILEEIERGLKKNHIAGAVVVKKSEVKERSEELAIVVNDYLRGEGYDTRKLEDEKECHILYILNPF